MVGGQTAVEAKNPSKIQQIRKDGASKKPTTVQIITEMIHQIVANFLIMPLEEARKGG